MNKYLLAGAVLIASCGAVHADGATPAIAPPTDDELLGLITHDADVAGARAIQAAPYHDGKHDQKRVDELTALESELAELYAKSVDRPSLITRIIATMRNDYTFGHAADSAPQVTQKAAETTAEVALLQAAQNNRIIEQNNQIIALLTKLANK